MAEIPTRRLLTGLIGVLITSLTTTLFPVRAEEEPLTFIIKKGTYAAEPIAVVPFGWRGDDGTPLQRLGEIIADNLTRTGRYEPIPFADLPSRPTEATEVNFTDWRILDTANLVIGSVTAIGPEQYSVRFRLFDVYRAKQLAGFEVQAGSRELRRVAHQISDIIYEELTGERGAFDTRIAYVTEQPGADNEKIYALNVADSDGFNAFTILESSQPVLSPAWSPDGGRLAYVSYEGARPRIFVQDLTSGTREEISAFPGINGAPAWAPDGRRLALTLSKDGNPEIYILDLGSRRLRRVTLNGAIDTEPAWSPDGQSLVFTSDRGGGPQIYRVDVRGGKPQRLTFEGKYNARARFSPDGKRLAFVHATKGAYRIGVLDLDNSSLRILTDTRLDESPSFAPNGSMILYATIDAGFSTLAAVSTDGQMHQQLAVQQGDVREPAWSPYRN